MVQYAPKQAKAPGAVTVKLIAPHGPDEDRAFASLLSAALDPVSAPLAEALANEQRMQVTSMSHSLVHAFLPTCPWIKPHFSYESHPLHACENEVRNLWDRDVK